jgi:hypothetical protein
MRFWRDESSGAGVDGSCGARIGTHAAPRRTCLADAVAGSRSKSRGRGRSRKRRPAAGASAAAEAKGALEGSVADVKPAAAPAKRDATKRASARARARDTDRREFRDPLSVGPRPQSPWHPLPLSELLILVGAIATVIGLKRASSGGISGGGPALFAGLGAVALGTFEVAWREHRAGYRSHAMLLAFLPVLIFHSAVVLGLSAFTTVPRLVNVGLLAIDLALFAVLFKLLRARFLTARARVISRS